MYRSLPTARKITLTTTRKTRPIFRGEIRIVDGWVISYDPKIDADSTCVGGWIGL